jgi:hypothetical protein
MVRGGCKSISENFPLALSIRQAVWLNLQSASQNLTYVSVWPHAKGENSEALARLSGMTLRSECVSIDRASQFSRYLLDTAGSFDQDTNARASAVKLNKNSYSRAFVAL